MGERGGHWRPVVDEIEPRAFGVPTRWIRRPAAPGPRFLRHPVHVLRWRLERRRRGPYARSYADVAAGRRTPSAPPERTEP